MSDWRDMTISEAVVRLGRWFRDQWVMDELPAWRDPLPDLPLLDLEQVDHELAGQMRLPRYERDFGLVTFLLDMRSALGATPADGELLHIAERAR